MHRVVGMVLVALLLVVGACSSGKSGGPVAIDLTIAQGKITPGTASYDVAKGSTVTITITSDAADTVHVHGYEIEKPIAAGATTVITFVADKTGRYEVETHVIQATIATLNVR